MLDVVSDPRVLRRALKRLARSLGGVPKPGVALGWRGGGRHTIDLRWRREEGFWWAVDQGDARWSFSFGATALPPPPRFVTPHSADLQIGVGVETTTRALSGAVLRADDGALALAHTGRLGGARAGGDRDSFRRFHRAGNWQAMRWPDGKVEESCVIGRIDGVRLPAHIGCFVRAARAFKRALGAAAAATAPRGPIGLDGPSLSYRLDPAILAQCDHGPVVEALRDELVRRGLGASDDAETDLFTHAGPRAPRLFDVRTDSSPASLQAAVGRLLLARAERGRGETAVLVAPDDISAAAAAAIVALGVRLVRYRWRGARPAFQALDVALDDR